MAYVCGFPEQEVKFECSLKLMIQVTTYSSPEKKLSQDCYPNQMETVSILEICFQINWILVASMDIFAGIHSGLVTIRNTLCRCEQNSDFFLSSIYELQSGRMFRPKQICKSKMVESEIRFLVSNRENLYYLVNTPSGKKCTSREKKLGPKDILKGLCTFFCSIGILITEAGVTLQ